MLVAEWIDNRPKTDKVKYRLVNTSPDRYAIERCEKDLLGGNRWVVVDAWKADANDTPSLLLTLINLLIDGQVLAKRTTERMG